MSAPSRRKAKSGNLRFPKIWFRQRRKSEGGSPPPLRLERACPAGHILFPHVVGTDEADELRDGYLTILCLGRRERSLSWRSRAPDPERSGVGRTPQRLAGCGRAQARERSPSGRQPGKSGPERRPTTKLVVFWKPLSFEEGERSGSGAARQRGGTVFFFGFRRIRLKRRNIRPPFLETEGQM